MKRTIILDCSPCCREPHRPGYRLFIRTTANRSKSGSRMPYGQDEVIGALTAANKHLVVVNISGNAVAMPWAKEVPAIVQAWYLRSEAGNALASVLTGETNPSGRIPFTFPAALEDVGSHKAGEYIGTRNDKVVDERYNEGIFVGYRGADKLESRPLFSFGHRLSYTTFEYGKAASDRSEMTADETITITVPVTNTGKRTGSEVVQLYISDKKSTLPRPAKELKGFTKITLAPGESREVAFTVDRSALSYFDDTRHAWVAEPGDFEALVAASATDIRSKIPFKLAK